MLSVVRALFVRGAIVLFAESSLTRTGAHLK